MGRDADVSVFYLIRQGIRAEGVVRFVQSYESNYPEADHELVIIYKGFDQQDPRRCNSVLSGVKHRALFVNDDGFDITAYLKAATKSKSRSCIFLNSHSVIVDKDWFEKIAYVSEDPSVGVVGCTGSWESRVINYLYDPRTSWFVWILKSLRARAFKNLFPKYPNPHIRTNAFIINRDLFLNLSIPEMASKRDAYNVESGRWSITRQIINRGMVAVVANSDGNVFHPNNWPDSKVYRSCNQEKLMISDNQTEQYRMASPNERSRLSSIAWMNDWSAPNK